MIKSHFFGRECFIDRELDNHDNLEKNLKLLNWRFEKINFVNQIHSNQVLAIDSKEKIQPKQGLAKADAIVTNLKNLAIAVVTADCGAIILQDQENEVVAAVHAGWRGAKSGVIENCLRQMVKLGAKKENISAKIGPMIRQQSYQVSQDFYDDFLADDQSFAQFFIADKVAEKFLFDLPAFIKGILQQQGINQIEDCQIDTYQQCDKYASYRKFCHDPQNYQNLRNISVVMIESS